jgi:hypothetical protein
MNLFCLNFEIYESIHEVINGEFQVAGNCKTIWRYFANLSFSNAYLYFFLKKAIDFIDFLLI